MSATELSPSQSIETALLNRHPNNSSQSSYSETDANSRLPSAPPLDGHEDSNVNGMDNQSSPTEHISDLPNQTTIATDAQDHDRMDEDIVPTPPDPENTNTLASPPSRHNTDQDSPMEESMNTPDNGVTSSDSQATITDPTLPETPVANPASTNTSRQEGQPNEPVVEDNAGVRSEVDEEVAEEEDDNGDSSSDDEEYWGGNRDFVARLKEDESTPSEDELKELKAFTEHSASDHEHFESNVHTALDDPEFVPVESGTITWTLKGFHGTKESPNKQRVMRSPPTTIGGYRWSIKVYPHGNDGTDYVSVYIECSGPESPADPAVVSTDDSNMQGVSAVETLAERTSETKESSSSTENDTKAAIDGSWEVPAQVGCVMYNPNEPRTYAFERSNYQFHDKNPDCGWVRFYGPWSSIHQRRHLQRQAMLRNDTLSFTAYIRVIDDPTRALWFRYGDEGIWDSIMKTGLRGLSAGDSAGQSVIAALAPWLHLAPFKKLVLETSAPQLSNQPRKPIRPLFQALQNAVYRKHAPDNHSPGYPESLSTVRKTLSLYGLDVRQSTDIVEIWETLRHSLNAEYYNDRTYDTKPDVLSFIKTIRQHVRPLLPSEDPESRKEPRSVQELLDQASEGDQSSYKTWDGYEHAVQNIPAVLQIELCRQRYDQSARKWKRLTHQIKMDDTINVGENKYNLFAMTISKGELGSGRVYSIVRAAGVDSQWAKYKSHYVTYLTRKQAVDCHEGKGVSREGTESVAYLVFYVRSDVADSVLRPAEYKPTSKVMFPLEKPVTVQDQTTLKVVVHGASSLKNYSGVTFLDPWSADESDSFVFDLDASADLIAVQKKLLELHPEAERPDQFRLWSLAANAKPVPHPKDLYLIDGPPRTKLSDCSFFYDSIRLWYQLIPIEKIDPEGGYRVVKTHLPPDIPPAPVALDAIPPPPLPVETVAENVVAVIVPDEAVQSENAPVVDRFEDERFEEQAPINDDEPFEEQPHINIQSSDDVVMGGTQEPPPAIPEEDPGTQNEHPENQAEIQEPPPLDSQMLDTPPPPPPQLTSKEEKIPEWQLPKEVYLLIKLFDPHTSKAFGLTSGFFPRDKKLSEIVSELQLPYKSTKVCRQDTNGIFDCYSLDSTPSNAGLSSGNVLVVTSNDISENDKEVIRSRGDVIDYAEWHDRVFSSTHFSKQAAFQSGSYFGGKYVHAPLHKGRFLGESIIISTNGDAYKGNCVDGQYHGQGVMYYANGNTYTGEWANGLPEGQGTMVYNQTGNKYIGGWKAGRKHGKGVMTYEVADEEMMLCKICYENEMDALFYRCGHVAACESCARQVNDCPVCRRPVDAVVRIWRTV